MQVSVFPYRVFFTNSYEFMTILLFLLFKLLRIFLFVFIFFFISWYSPSFSNEKMLKNLMPWKVFSAGINRILPMQEI